MPRGSKNCRTAERTIVRTAGTRGKVDKERGLTMTRLKKSGYKTYFLLLRKPT